LSVLLAYADKLEEQLSSSDGVLEVSPALVDELDSRTKAFTKTLGVAAASRGGDLDGKGTALWNLSTRLKRSQHQDGHPTPVIVGMVRMFALQMLFTAEVSGTSSTDNTIRVLRVALKTTKSCLELDDYAMAAKALERAAELEDKLQTQLPRLTPEDTDAHMKLSTEYLLLRSALAWRQGQLEVAEHMYNKTSVNGRQLDPATAENFSDLLLKIGNDALSANNFELAVKWLARAYAVLSAQEPDKLSFEANELRITVIQSYVKALIKVERPEAVDRARELVEGLENEIGDKLVVLLLRLDLLSAGSEVFDGIAYSTIIRRMIRIMTPTDENFKRIISKIRKLHEKNPSLACSTLDDLLQTRVLQAERTDWVEITLTNRLWMATSLRETEDALPSIRQVLQGVQDHLGKPISSSAAFAAQALIWKRIQSNAALGQHATAESWCRLALHPLFENAGQLNNAKIARKLLMCALAKLDMNEAQDIYNKLSDAARREPKTQFFMYKIAVRVDDVDLAASCLESVYNASSTDPSMLYACVLDAQQAGSKEMAVRALQLILKKYQYNAPPELRIPALLRCTIRLISDQLNSKAAAMSDQEFVDITEKLCGLFEAAVHHAQQSVATKTITQHSFDTKELDWFSKNAYNLGLKHATEWEPRKVLRLLQSCIALIGLYPDDIDQQVLDDLSLRQMFCDFLGTVMLIALARGEDNIELQLQDYLQVRKHVRSFDNTLQSKLEKLEQGPAEDLLKKLSIMLAYDFEAAVRLKGWDDLGEIVRRAAICRSTKVYELMADCLLCYNEAPTHGMDCSHSHCAQADSSVVVVQTLKTIVNGAWEVEEFDITKLAKYMRCLFQYALPEGGPIAEDLLDQVVNLAKESSEVRITSFSKHLELTVTGRCAVSW
jgi:tetratricopeptide (TPR) repeat protein